MKWWKKAIIASAVWIILAIGAAFVHTEIILKDKITPAQDSAISEVYGRMTIIGLIPIWVILQLISRRRK